MEPVRGGNLVNLRQEALDILEENGSGSPASYAIRYAAALENQRSSQCCCKQV